MLISYQKESNAYQVSVDIIALILSSFFWVPFLFSAQSYKEVSWYSLLIGSRLILFIVPIFAIGAILLLKKSINNFLAWYYIIAMLNQSFHGYLEPRDKIDFYSYTSLFLMLNCIAYRGTIKSWIKNMFPFVVFAHIVPLVFKNAIFFTSLGDFVDKFTLNVALVFLSIILLHITTSRHVAFEKNKMLSVKLLNEKENRLKIIEDELAVAQEKIRESEHKQAFVSVATQVSHDIRSPLSALNMMLMDLKELPEQKRVIVRSALQRINDISNSLLEKSKGQTVSSPTQSSTSPVAITSAGATEVVLLSSVVGELLSEKRIQFRDKADVSIEEDLTKAYGYFVSVKATELKRVLSNLINNAIEAFPEGKGRVTVGIRGYKDVVQIIISDNGKGIPASVLAKLGERGVSHGKESSGTSGSGLGVYHAKSTVESYGGKFEIQSREGRGTMIQIQLPRAVAPEWFVPQISLAPHMKVFIVDDDSSIHGVWKERFQSLEDQPTGMDIYNYTDVNQFIEIVQSLSSQDLARTLFLVDYEFLGQDLCGVEIVQKLEIQKQSILVTSYADHPQLQKQCQDLGLRLIPKSLSTLVPIRKMEDS